MGAPNLREQVKEFITREVRNAIERGELSANPDDKSVVSPAPRADESVWRYLHRRVSELRDRDGQPVVPVLVFDQFEEIFTLKRSGKIGENGFRPFLRELGDCVENRLPEEIKEQLQRDPDARSEFANLELGRQKYRIILSLREDYVAHLDDLSEMMPSTMENRMRLLPLDGRQALNAVLNPGRASTRRSRSSVSPSPSTRAASGAEASATPSCRALARIAARSTPRPSSVIRSATLFRSRLAESRIRPSGAFPAATRSSGSSIP